MKYLSFKFLLIGCFVFGACNSDDSGFGLDDIEFLTNVPIVANSSAGYSYSLGLSDDFNSSRTDNLDFASDIVDFSIVITNYTSGDGNVYLMDSAGDTLRTDAINGNNVIAQNDLLIEDLDRVAVSLENYNGTIVLALAP